MGTAVVEEPVFEGALKRNSLVMALVRGSQTDYQLAKIIDVRKQKHDDEEDQSIDRMLLGTSTHPEE